LVGQSNKSKCAELRKILRIIDASSLFASTEIRVQFGTDFQTEFEKGSGDWEIENEGKERKRKKEENRAKAVVRGRSAREA